MGDAALAAALPGGGGSAGSTTAAWAPAALCSTRCPCLLPLQLQARSLADRTHLFGCQGGTGWPTLPSLAPAPRPRRAHGSGRLGSQGRRASPRLRPWKPGPTALGGTRGAQPAACRLPLFHTTRVGPRLRSGCSWVVTMCGARWVLGRSLAQQAQHDKFPGLPMNPKC